MLTLEAVTRSFGDRTILDRIDLQVDPGERVGISGISGCGKTTLLRLIAGLDLPDRGSVRIAGELASDANRLLLQPCQRQVGFVFQTPSLWPHLSVTQNILFGLGQLPKAQAAERLHEVLSNAGIEHLAERYPDTLSGGEQRRVAVARTLAPKPSVLLMDEPLTNLDRASKTQISSMLNSMIEDYANCLIYVSHDTDELYETCQRTYVLANSNLKSS